MGDLDAPGETMFLERLNVENVENKSGPDEACVRAWSTVSLFGGVRREDGRLRPARRRLELH